MSADLHRRAREVFLKAIELAGEARAALLSEACGDDESLRSEVESLLGELGAGESFLEDDAASQLAGFGERRLPKRIGRYRILRLLGEGGMGVVYEAEQEQPQRRVALKLLRHGPVTEATARRIRREAELLGRLHHPGIAQIHEAGVAEGDDGAPQPFFAMELVEGLDLATHCKAEGLDVPERLELFARACDAVHHAHAGGVIHRDLKPDNILVHADGRPKVLDFGIARATDPDLLSASLRTATGQIVGTLAYMSPEQVEGRRDQVDARADVYALGVILHELLTGAPPHDLRGLALPEALSALRTEPQRIGTFSRRLGGDLEIIVGRALERDPRRRYPSAAALAEDLRRHLRDEPIRARAPSLGYRALKFTRRHRALVGATLLALGLLSIGLAVAVRQAFVAHEAGRREAEQRRLAERNDYRARLAAAETALRFGTAATARSHLDAAPEDLRGWEWQHLRARLDDATLVLSGSSPGRLRFTSDDRLLLTSDEPPLVKEWDLESGAVETLGGLDEEGRPWLDARLDLAVPWTVNPLDTELPATLRDERGRPRATIHACPPGSPLALRPVPDRPELAWSAPTSQSELDVPVRICEWRTGRVLFEGSAPATLRVVAVDEQRSRVAMGANAGWLQLRELATGGLVAAPRGHVDYVNDLRFSADGALLLSASQDRSIRTWDAESGEPVGVLPGHDAYTRAATFSPEGRRIASVGNDGTLRLWDLATQGATAVLRGHGSRVASVAWSPNGKRLASLDEDSELRIWDAQLSPAAWALRGHSSYVYPATFGPNGRLLATGAWDGTWRLWDVETLRPIGGGKLTGPSAPSGVQVAAWLAFSPEGRRLAVGAIDGRVELRSLPGGELLAERPAGPVRCFRGWWHPDGRWLLRACFGNAGVADRLEWLDGRDLSVIRRREGLKSPLVLGPGGDWFLAASDSGLQRVGSEGGEPAWSVESGRRFERLALDPQGDRFAAADASGVVTVHELATGKLIAELRAAEDGVLALAFSPDGERLATGGRDGIVRIWDCATWTELLLLRGHSSYVYDLRFDPSGRRLVSTSGDYTVRVWSTQGLGAVAKSRRRLDGPAASDSPGDEFIRALARASAEAGFNPGR